MTEEHKHKFEYKETIRMERFGQDWIHGEYVHSGKRVNDNLVAIFFCKCGEFKKEYI